MSAPGRSSPVFNLVPRQRISLARLRRVRVPAKWDPVGRQGLDQHGNLRRFPFILDYRVIQYERKALKSRGGRRRRGVDPLRGSPVTPPLPVRSLSAQSRTSPRNPLQAQFRKSADSAIQVVTAGSPAMGKKFRTFHQNTGRVSCESQLLLLPKAVTSAWPKSRSWTKPNPEICRSDRLCPWPGILGLSEARLPLCS
jgi:hypothetical protein